MAPREVVELRKQLTELRKQSDELKKQVESLQEQFKAASRRQRAREPESNPAEQSPRRARKSDESENSTRRRARRVSKAPQRVLRCRVPEVRLSQLTKHFPHDVTAVSDVELTIGDGELLVLVGPSGCGKSTTLRLIAGLEQPTRGTIHFDRSRRHRGAAGKTPRRHGVPGRKPFFALERPRQSCRRTALARHTRRHRTAARGRNGAAAWT